MRLAALVLCSALAVPPLEAQAPPEPSRPEVAASGSGEVKVRPDQVHVSFTVVTRGASAAEAGRQNMMQMGPLLEALRRQSIPDSALNTIGYSVARDGDEEWTPAGRRTRAENEVRYTARNAVSVTIHELDRIGGLIDTALAAGASEVENISWASSAVNAHRLTALGLAVTAARAEAEAMAKAAGGSLGALIEINEGGQYGVAGGVAARLSLSRVVLRGTSMSPRDLTVAANVRVRWVFVPGTR
jgi:hypothetical protein